MIKSARTYTSEEALVYFSEEANKLELSQDWNVRVLQGKCRDCNSVTFNVLIYNKHMNSLLLTYLSHADEGSLILFSNIWSNWQFFLQDILPEVLYRIPQMEAEQRLRLIGNEALQIAVGHSHILSALFGDLVNIDLQ